MKMNKLVLVCLITGVAGLVIGGLGLAQGARVYGISLSGNGVYVNSNHNTVNSAGYQYIKETISLEEFDSLKMNVNFADVNVVNSDHFGIQYCLREDRALEYMMNDKTMTINQLHSNMGFSIFSMGSVNIGKNSEREFITLYIPKDKSFSQVTLENDSGDITVENIKAEQINVNDSFGDFKAENLSAGLVDLDLDSGEININNLDADKLTVKDSFGDVTIDNVIIKKGDIGLDSGNLRCESIKADELILDVSFGNVKADKASTGSFTANLDSGDFTVEVLESDSFDINSNFGDVEIGLEGTVNDYSIVAKTDFGDITVNKEDMETKFMNGNSGALKTVSIQCDSGSIKIKDAKYK